MNIELKEKNKKKKRVLAIIGFSALTVLGSTLAYFTTSKSFVNDFKTGKYDHEIIETFTSPSNWIPGETIEKNVKVTNNGTIDMALRASYTESWVSKNNESLPLKQKDNNVAIINFDNSWTKAEDGYYYYGTKDNMTKLTPNETSSSFITGVTFNENTEFSLKETVSEDGKTVTFTSSGNGYDDATYTLTIKIDTIQYNEAKDIWM